MAKKSALFAYSAYLSPEDAYKIRSFLLSNNQKNKKINDDDPIHDQNHYIDNFNLEWLKNNYDVEPFIIIQYLGDAVFIPAV